jgi:hypothetical protein
VAESADALDLGSSGRLSLGGSNPLARTNVWVKKRVCYQTVDITLKNEQLLKNRTVLNAKLLLVKDDEKSNLIA